MPRGISTIIRVKVRCKIPEDSHWDFPNLPAEFHRHIENQKTVDTRLIATRIAGKMDVKRVAVAGVVVEGWRELKVYYVRKIKLRSYLPAEQECIGGRNLLGL